MIEKQILISLTFFVIYCIIARFSRKGPILAIIIEAAIAAMIFGVLYYLAVV